LHPAPQVEADSLALHAIARRLRARRFGNGALRLDNTRLYFTLDAEGQPVAGAPYVQQVGQSLTHPLCKLLAVCGGPFGSNARRQRLAPPLCILPVFLLVLGSAPGPAIKGPSSPADLI
jgi:hypothetical protein